MVYVDAPSLDLPALQWDEEANAFLLAPLLHSQEQVIVQKNPAVPVASSLVRAVQPVDVEPVLDVPVLNTDGDDPGISSDELDRMLLQCDIRDYLVARGPGLFGSGRFVEQEVDVPVPLLFPPAVSPGFGSLEQVVDVPVPHHVYVPLSDVSEEDMEQVVDVPVPHRLHASHFDVSEEVMEQVVDVPVPRRVPAQLSDVSEEVMEQVVDAPGLRADARARSAAGSPTSRAAAASLENPQETSHGFFRTFPQNKKKCDGWAAVECALQLVHTGGLWSR